MQYDGAMTDTNAQRYFYLHDRLGSVRQVIDEDANIKNCYTYDPWGLAIGDETAETGTFFNPYRFGGYFWEPEITQYHCFRRQYDPVLARFTSRDPITGDFKEPLTLHAYLYCANDPMNKTDPSGESAQYYWMKMQTTVAAASLAVLSSAQRIVEIVNFRSAQINMLMNRMFGPISSLYRTISNRATPVTWQIIPKVSKVINGITYWNHAVKRMVQRGIPPSVVENALQWGKVLPGNTACRIVIVYENVRVVYDPIANTVISVM